MRLMSHRVDKVRRPGGFSPTAGAECVSLGSLFWTFLKIGTMAYRSSMTLLAVIADTLVNKRQLLTQDDMHTYLSHAKLFPGPHSVNCAAYIGYRLHGRSGALASVCGILLPTFGLIVILTGIYIAYANHIPAAGGNAAKTVYAGVVIFAAYLVRGVAGFGSGLIAVPLLALQFPVTVVVPIVVLLDYLGSASQGLKNRGHIAWKEQLPLIPFTLLGIGAGLILLQTMKAAMLGKTLGVFVLIYAVYQLLPLPPLRGSRIFIIPFGCLGGFVGTLFGTGGPFYVMYFALRELPRHVFRATFALNFLIDGAIRLIAYVTAGFFHRELLFFLPAVLPVAALALLIGGRVQTRFSQQDFVRFISVLLLGSGIALLLK